MTDPQGRPAQRVSGWVKVQTLLLAAVLVLLAILVLVVGMTARHMEKGLDLVQADLESLEMDKVNTAIASLSEAADRLADVDISQLNETAQSLQAAAEGLASVDVDTMNKAVISLKEAADTLKALDMEALNGVIRSIDKTVQGLETAVNTLKGIFGH